MLPSAILRLEKLPTMLNGKLDRGSLPDVELASAREPEPARTPLEARLLAIWQDVLRRRDIGVRDHFFEIGGNSLVAVRMLTALEQRIGTRVPLAALFLAPTVETLAQYIAVHGDQPSGWRPLIILQQGADRPPLFFVHGIGGGVYPFLALAKYIDDDVPVYGLQAIDLGGAEDTGYETIEELAAFYVKTIRDVQPHGPYHLAGQSFGGVVALEMAQQLNAVGEEVGMLGLLDTYGYSYMRYRRVWRWFVDQAKGLLRAGPRGLVPYLRIRGQAAKRIVARRIWWNKQRRNAVLGGGLPEARGYAEGMKFMKALASYDPKPYDGKISLFRAHEQPAGVVPDRALGWGSLAKGGIEIYDVPGGHETLIEEPYVDKLAVPFNKALNARLDAPGRESEPSRAERRRS
jgi:thioesterase domain-containing protein/acyl carrier protein